MSILFFRRNLLKTAPSLGLIVIGHLVYFFAFPVSSSLCCSTFCPVQSFVSAGSLELDDRPAGSLSFSDWGRNPVTKLAEIITSYKGALLMDWLKLCCIWDARCCLQIWIIVEVGIFFLRLCRAASIPRAKGGVRLQMKLVYNQLAPLFLFLLQWMDCSCACLLPRYLNLFHILIYKVCISSPQAPRTNCNVPCKVWILYWWQVYPDGRPTISSYGRKASIKDFYGMNFFLVESWNWFIPTGALSWTCHLKLRAHVFLSCSCYIAISPETARGLWPRDGWRSR